MGKRAIIRSVLALCLTAAGLAAVFGLMAGTQSQVYAASSRPESGAASTESAPLSGPAASPSLAPLSNGSETAVITVCNSCPYTTVQAAVSDIPSGGIVKVAQGTYTDTDADSRVVYITKSLTLQGGYTTTNWSVSDPAAHPTTLDGEDSGRVIMIVSGISPTIEGFHIINGSGALGGGVYIVGGGTVLQRNRIYDNAATDRGGGICVAGGAPILRNNFIYTNTAANGGGGVCVTNGSAPLLHHNTLYDNLASGTGGGVYIASGAPVISATIIVSNTASDGGGVYGAGGLLGYNDVWGNSGGEYGGGATAGSNSISNDPLFADPSGLDLRIQAGSPCKDQVPSAQMAEVDYWGLARPFGAQADIGAHEFYTGDCFARIGVGQVYSTVQAAVDVAGAGDLVKVAGICRGVQSRTVGSIVLTQTVFISKALTLRGGYTATNWTASDPDAYPTTLDAQEQGRVVYIGGVAAMVESFQIRNGGPPSGNGGGIYIVGGSPVVRNNSIYSNTTAGAEGGGGIYIYAGTPTVENNAIYYNNSATANGGGLHNRDGSPIVRNNTIYSNTANRGGGIYVAAGDDSHIQSNWIYSNTAGTMGGGIYAAAGYIQSNWIYSNAAGTRGGGIYVAAGLRIESNWIHSNRANGSLSDDGGGGIYVASGASAIRGNAIYNNVINGSSGGGINIWSDGVVVEQNTIHHNSGGYRGGGIYVRDYNQTIRNNLIYNNSANSFGGGITYWWGNGTIENNTIYSNTLDGIYNAEVHSGSPTIRNNIIVSNTTYGIRRGSGSLTVYYNDVSGNSTSNYFNINSTTDITATPQLVNPGVDFRLQPGSSCIDAADPSNYPAADYASYARPFGSRADMGAYEFYAGTCFAQVEGATQVYTTVQAALDVVTQATTVKVAGLCQGAQPRPVGSETFTQTAYISQSLTMRGGYTVTNWTTPTAQTILDAVGQGRAVYITGTGAVTVDGFIVRGGNAITGGGLYFATPLSPTVQNVIFYSNTAQYGGGLASAGGNPRLYNNTFVTNTATVTGGGVYLAGGSPAISNTIVVSNAGGGIWAGSGASLAYNDVWENAGGDYVGSAAAGATDFSADPLFANFAERDFHLALSSPCVHTADPGTALAWDLEGDDRPLGRRADVGADENAIYADVRFAPFSWLDGIPDQPTVHPHILTNTGSINDTFDLTHTLVTSDSTGWEVYYTPVFTLAAGEVAESPVTVVVPATAISGTAATVILTATSAANGDIYDVVSNTTMVNWNPGVELEPAYAEHVNPGTVMTYAHTLTNTGNAPDTFDLSFSSSYGWTKEVTPTQVVDLGAQVTTTVWVRVEVPATAPGRLIETTVITAVSPSSGVRALVTDTTEVNYTTGDRYVATAGGATDTLNNCLVPSTPCRTIGHAVGQAVSGDTVKVREGTYNENNVTLNKDITLRGGYYDTDWKSDPANHPAIVDAQGAGRVFYVFGNPTIEGFTIRGGGTAGSGGGIYIYSLGSPIIRGNVITGNTAGVHGGGIHNELGNPTIEQNTLAYNEASRGGGFSSAAGSPGFWSNMVYDNQASTNGGGVYVSGGNARVWHDTIYHNTAQNGGGVYLAGGSPVVSNTIVVTNTAIITGGGVYKQAVGAALDYNDVWDNTNGDYVGATTGPNSISDDPGFMNEAARDLHLESSSPCENEGDATAVTEDYDGQPRTMGSAPDIGADEIRQLGVELEPDGAKSGDPGTQITYDHVVTNTGNYTDTFTITASSSRGWSVETPSNPVAVGSGQSTGIQVKVAIPSDAVWGVEDRTVVTATSGINPDLSDSAVDTTTVNLKCGIAWLG